MTTLLIATVALLGTLFLLYNIGIFFVTQVPYIKTPSARFDQIFTELQGLDPRPRQDLTFFDIGSGLGHVVRAAVRQGYGHVIGIEASPAHALISRGLLWRQPRATIKTGDAMTAELGRADVIYYFLTSRAMPRLTNALKRYAKPGTVIIGLGNPLQDWPAVHQFTAAASGAVVYFYRV